MALTVSTYISLGTYHLLRRMRIARRHGSGTTAAYISFLATRTASNEPQNEPYHEERKERTQHIVHGVEQAAEYHVTCGWTDGRRAPLHFSAFRARCLERWPGRLPRLRRSARCTSSMLLLSTGVSCATRSTGISVAICGAPTPSTSVPSLSTTATCGTPGSSPRSSTALRRSLRAASTLTHTSVRMGARVRLTAAPTYVGGTKWCVLL